MNENHVTFQMHGGAVQPAEEPPAAHQQLKPEDHHLPWIQRGRQTPGDRRVWTPAVGQGLGCPGEESRRRVPRAQVRHQLRGKTIWQF